MLENGKIVVAGDVTIDWIQWVTKQGEYPDGTISFNWTLFPGTRMKAEPGGAILIARMVRTATNVEVATHELSGIENIPPEKVLHSIVLLDSYPITVEGKEKVYRVKQQGGFSGPLNGGLRPLPIVNDDAGTRLVILDDAGNGFRDDRTEWPQAILKNGK